MFVEPLEFLSDNYQRYVKALFAVYKEELFKCGSNFDKLRAFYENCFSNINSELANEVRETCVGYYIFNSGFGLVKKAKTINELLHVMHAAIVNDETTYGNIPLIARRENDNGKYIDLVGVKNDIAFEIFNSFPSEIFSDRVNIMSFSNKVIIDKYGRSSNPNIYFIGDCSGWCRGLTTAGSHGILCAENILKF